MEHFDLENPAVLEIIGENKIAGSELSAEIERDIPTVQTQAHILLPPSELPTVEIVEDSSRNDLSMAPRSDQESKASFEKV